VGWELYEKFFKGYTMKQWKRHPKDLDASVCGRIPIRTNRDDRYLREEFQALPAAGYTRMFERILEAGGPRVKVLLNTDYREVLPHVRFKHLVYTGPIDEFFEYVHGDLPYRSLRFENESFTADELKPREAISGRPGFWQPAMQVNYPNEEEFTRIVEVKHATGQRCTNTTIVREYPEDYQRGGEAYYPIPAPDAAAIYTKYKEMAEVCSANPLKFLPPSTACAGASFIGRLATYRYYNMDQVVGMALAESDKLRKNGL
jgi:UDP-galactopyranose mutase